MGGNGTAIGVFFLYDEMMIYRGITCVIISC